MARSWFVPKAAVVAVVLGVAAAGMLLNVSAAPAGGNKNYSASITAGTPAPGGTSTSFTVRIRNCGTGSPAPCTSGAVSTQYLGSANITFPAGFSSVVPTDVTTSNGKPWIASVSGNTVQLRNNGSNTSYALAPGDYVTVTVTATTPNDCSKAYQLTTKAKQSNDFSGTGNDFNLVGSQPSVTISPGAALAQLKWTTQPGSP